MKPSNIVTWLSWLIAVLALLAAGIGLFYQDGGGTFSFPTLCGEAVQIYGQGLYRYDTPITAVGFHADTLLIFTADEVAHLFAPPTRTAGGQEVEAASVALAQLAASGLLCCQRVNGQLRYMND
jgi:uncharacterized protein YqgC (DUF456 family)